MNSRSRSASALGRRVTALSRIGKTTEAFLRFSTVAGERGAADAERDLRGFALRFYTEEGNWDIVGDNTPVFFVRDSLKFPDFIHTQKRHPKTNLRTDAYGGSAENNVRFAKLVCERTSLLLDLVVGGHWLYVEERASRPKLQLHRAFGVPMKWLSLKQSMTALPFLSLCRL